MTTVKSGGAANYCEGHGEGPAVVFAHGRGGNPTSWWQQGAWFSERFQVIVFDRHTYGRSRACGETFTQALRGGYHCHPGRGRHWPAALVGQSMGGWCFLGAALAHPGRVRALVMSSIPGGLLSPAMEGRMAQTRGRPDSLDKLLS